MSDSAKPLELVLLTGLSGSGKSTAAKSLEDLGYYCIDNLPLPLLRYFLQHPLESQGEGLDRIALVTDLRAPGLVSELPGLLDGLDPAQVNLGVVFLETSDEVLVRRYSETRRRHPLAEGSRVIEGIRRERELLKDLRGRADLVMDTSDWTVHEVRAEIYREFGNEENASGLRVSVMSFGFKHGSPLGADLVFDVRYLSNPYFVPGLRELRGDDPKIQEYLSQTEEWPELVDRLEDFVTYLLPKFQAENRSYLTVAIGCTGGHHRSVATAEHISARLIEGGWSVNLLHRDISR